MPHLQNISRSFSQLGAGLAHLFFPSLCQGCNKPLNLHEEVICLNCEAHLSKTNFHHIPENETALRITGRIPFIHATSFAYFTHEGLLQHLVHGLKYQGRQRNGIFLGKQLGLALKDQDWKIDAVIPVPIHKTKQWARGYNQSQCIADGIGHVLQVPVYSEVIIRHRVTESQVEKTREQRAQNVKDAFKVLNEQKLKGSHVLLVDDVLTTGATIEACARPLLAVDGIKVSVATIGLAV